MRIPYLLILSVFFTCASCQQDAFIMSSLGDHGDRITDLESIVTTLTSEFTGLNKEVVTLKEENRKLLEEIKTLTEVCNKSQCCQCSNHGNEKHTSTSLLNFTSSSSVSTVSAPRVTTVITRHGTGHDTTTVRPVTNTDHSQTVHISKSNATTTTSHHLGYTTTVVINPSTTSVNSNTSLVDPMTSSIISNTTSVNSMTTSVNSMTTYVNSNTTSTNPMTTTTRGITSPPVTVPTTTVPQAYDNCMEAVGHGDTGIVNIKLGSTGRSVQANCDSDGWLVIQRRQTDRQDFNQDWNTYKHGFGNLKSDFWFGNDNIHLLTSNGDYTLHIDMEDWAQNKKFAEYAHFRIENEIRYYKLFVGSYSGTAGDSFHYPQSYQLTHFQMPFSTPDRDNDRSVQNCAGRLASGWWFNDCYSSNLNGRHLPRPYGQRNLGEIYGQPTLEGTGVEWYPLKRRQYSLKKVEMKIKPQLVSAPMG